MMLRVLLRRIVRAFAIFFVVSVLVFLLLHLAPGDPATRMAAIGGGATPEQIERIRAELGLNDPLQVQYARWMGSILRGDLGTSLFGGASVADTIGRRIPVTLSLTLGAMLVALAIGIPAGIVAGSRPGHYIDRLVIIGATVGISSPAFVTGLLLVLFLSHIGGWFPATSYVDFGSDPLRWLHHLALPSLALGIGLAAELARHVRASLRDTLHQDYVRTAVAKGLPWRLVIGKHAMRNALLPVVTMIGLQVTYLLGGAIVIEQVFGLPGVGALAAFAVFARDYPMIQGIALIAVAVVLVVNLIVDVSYTRIDPRVRLA
jgi:peptide/nickel transport system permease protein